MKKLKNLKTVLSKGVIGYLKINLLLLVEQTLIGGPYDTFLNERLMIYRLKGDLEFIYLCGINGLGGRGSESPSLWVTRSAY